MTSPRRLLPSELADLREGLYSPKFGPWAAEAIKQIFGHIDALQAEIDDHSRAITDHGDDELPLDEDPPEMDDAVEESFKPEALSPGVEVEEGI